MFRIRLQITQQIVTQHPLLSLLQSTTENSLARDIKVRLKIFDVYLKCNNGYKDNRNYVKTKYKRTFIKSWIVDKNVFGVF